MIRIVERVLPLSTRFAFGAPFGTKFLRVSPVVIGEAIEIRAYTEESDVRPVVWRMLGWFETGPLPDAPAKHIATVTYGTSDGRFEALHLYDLVAEKVPAELIRQIEANREE